MQHWTSQDIRSCRLWTWSFAGSHEMREGSARIQALLTYEVAANCFDSTRLSWYAWKPVWAV